MEMNNYYGGTEAICESLSSTMIKKIIKIRNTPAVWQNIFPAECYISDFSWVADTAPVYASENFGSFRDMTLKETNDVPSVSISFKSEKVNLYSQETEIKASMEEIEHFNYWMSNGSFENSSYINRLVEATRDLYVKTHDNLFFFGNTGKTEGLLNNSGLVDWSSDSELTALTDVIELFKLVVCKVREQSKGTIKIGKVLISNRLYTKLLKYYESSDLSDLEKLMKMPINTDADGTPLYLKIMIIDKLAPESDATPYGDIIFLTDDPSCFMYYYKPLMIYPFRPYLGRSFIASVKFRYSSPYVAAKYAAIKFTPKQEFTFSTNSLNAQATLAENVKARTVAKK